MITISHDIICSVLKLFANLFFLHNMLCTLNHIVRASYICSRISLALSYTMQHTKFFIIATSIYTTWLHAHDL